MAKQNTSRVDRYECGTPVKILHCPLHGSITGVIERFGEFRYEVTFWVSGDRKSEWMHESEFTTDARKKPIGFK